MKPSIKRSTNMERHSRSVMLARALLVPFMNALPSPVVRGIMQLSGDALAVSRRPGSTHALEVMYSRSGSNMYGAKSVMGMLDFFWHHLFSQPKAIRNRLRLVRKIITEDIERRFEEGQRSLSILSVGGGSTRALMECMKGLLDKGIDISGIKVTNVDKSADAIELGRENSRGLGVSECFNWICADARDTGSLVPAGSVDIVEMVGLLDYFDYGKSVNVISMLYRASKDDGLFVAANVHPNPEKVLVRKTGWPEMYYREPEEFRKILKEAGFTRQAFVYIEPLKVHMVATVRK